MVNYLEFEITYQPSRINRANRLRRHRTVYRAFSFTDLTYDNCMRMFRFSYEQIDRITTALGLQDYYKFGNKTVGRNLGFAMLCRRLSSTKLVYEHAEFFSMSTENMSSVLVGMEKEVYGRIKWGISFNTVQMAPANLVRFSRAIANKSQSYEHIVGFIDGTLQYVCRPTSDRQLMIDLYNGWKNQHCLKYQAIVTPDGITSSCLGAYPGRRHDQYVYSVSETERRLEKYLQVTPPPPPPAVSYAVYGDPAYQPSYVMCRKIETKDCTYIFYKPITFSLHTNKEALFLFKKKS